MLSIFDIFCYIRGGRKRKIKKISLNKFQENLPLKCGFTTKITEKTHRV